MSDNIQICLTFYNDRLVGTGLVFFPDEKPTTYKRIYVLKSVEEVATELDLYKKHLEKLHKFYNQDSWLSVKHCVENNLNFTILDDE